MSERTAFRSAVCTIKLGNTVNAVPEGWRHHMIDIATFIDTLMIHMGWPTELWAFGATPTTATVNGAGLLRATLELKEHKDASPVGIVLTFQLSGFAPLCLLSQDEKQIVAPLPSSDTQPSEAGEARVKAAALILDAVAKAVR